MFRRVAYLTASIALLAVLGGCGFSFFRFEEREPWRDQVEAACLASHEVVASTFIEPMRAINGPRICGLRQPFKVSALANGEVDVHPSATLGCPMTAAVERWLRDSVQPAAMAQFGAPVVEIKPLSSYGCRPVNNIRGEQLSEHAFGNALDVGGFRFADGTEISVERGWRGNPAERWFLRTAFVGACNEFYTVLGPGSDSYHYNHFHLDLRASNGRSSRHICRPQVEAPPPLPSGAPMVLAPPAGVDMTSRTGSISRVR